MKFYDLLLFAVNTDMMLQMFSKLNELIEFRVLLQQQCLSFKKKDFYTLTSWLKPTQNLRQTEETWSNNGPKAVWKSLQRVQNWQESGLA